jgi:undecaprenyl-diphosphatase
MEAFNHSLFLLINSLAGHSFWLDRTAIALGEYLPYLFILIEIWLYFFANRKEEALLAFYATLLGLGINQLIGLVYFHPRPFMDGLGTLLVPHAAENSFPSDHTTFMVSIALTLLLLPRTERWGGWLLILAIAGGLARVFIGVHYPLDILGSLVVSTLSSLSVVMLSPQLKRINEFFYRLEKKIFKGHRRS